MEVSEWECPAGTKRWMVTTGTLATEPGFSPWLIDRNHFVVDQKTGQLFRYMNGEALLLPIGKTGEVQGDYIECW